MAEVDVAQGKWDKAVPELEQALKIKPAGRRRRGDAWPRPTCGRKSPPGPSPWPRSGSRRTRRMPLPITCWARFKLSQRNFPKAEESFRKAIELQPLWPAPHNNLAGLFLVQGKKDEAIKGLESAIKANPDNLGAYLSIAADLQPGEGLQEGHGDLRAGPGTQARSVGCGKTTWRS